VVMNAWVKWWTQWQFYKALSEGDRNSALFFSWMIGLESKVCVCVFESLQGGTQTDSQRDNIILGRLRWFSL